MDDGYFTLSVAATDDQAADAAMVGVFVDGIELLRSPVGAAPDSAAVGGQTLADLDARYAAPMGLLVLDWPQTESASLSTNGPKCSSRDFTVSRDGTYQFVGRWNVVTNAAGACRFVNCYLTVDGVNVGIQGDENDGLVHLNAGVSGTYQTGYAKGALALTTGSPHTLQWHCQKSDCISLDVQCLRHQVIVTGPYVGL